MIKKARTYDKGGAMKSNKVFLNKLFFTLMKNTTYMTIFTIKGNGLISIRDFFQPTIDVQVNFIKHKSALQNLKEK
jgi:hypothetical protein